MTYFRATDPYPLEASDWNKLHAFYDALAAGRLVTTRCDGCGHVAWPPRGCCPECASDRYTWVELPSEGRVHGFTVQDAGLPAGFTGTRVFAIVKVDNHRIFSVIIDTDPSTVSIGQRVVLSPIRVDDDPKGNARWLPAFRPA
jgi:uncharacterized OB-fold protein